MNWRQKYSSSRSCLASLCFPHIQELQFFRFSFQVPLAVGGPITLDFTNNTIDGKSDQMIMIIMIIIIMIIILTK